MTVNLRSRQGGGWLSMLYTFGSLGFIVYVAMKVYPIYLNEMKLARAVTRVAAETSANTESGSATVKAALQKWWNVEDIEVVKPADVKIKASDGGKVLAYEYWNQVELMKNIYISFYFEKAVPLGNSIGE